MRKRNGQFRSSRPTEAEMQAMMLLVESGWLKFEVKGVDTE